MPKLITPLGENKYRLRVNLGRDDMGNPISKSKTVLCPRGEEQALEELGRFKESLKNTKVAKRKTSTTLSTFIDRWTDEYVLVNANSPTTIDYYKNMRKRIDEALGHLSITKITTSHINRFIIAMKSENNRHTGKPLADRTIKKYQEFLKLIFATAVKWNYISKNPCEGINPLKVAKSSKKEIPDAEDMKKLLEAVKSESLVHQAMFQIMIGTGLRREEIAGLKWKYVYLEEKALRVEEALVKSSQHSSVQKGTKSEAGHRTVDLTDEITICLSRLLQERSALRSVLTSTGKFSAENFEYVFLNAETGKPFHPDSISHWLPKLCEKNHIKRFSPHALRHWFCSTLLDAKVPVKIVQEMLGHADASTTLNVYAHVVKDTKTSTAATISSYLKDIGGEGDDAKA